MFKAKTGIDVKVVAQGSGQALDTARRGDADVVFGHARAEEDKIIAQGFGVRRFDVMYNDFVLIGTRPDPAQARGNDIVAALKQSAQKADPSFPAAIAAARMWPSSCYGRQPGSILRGASLHGIARSAKAWVPRSTPRCDGGVGAFGPRDLDLVQEQA